jgi:hypothetical protein
MEDFASQLDDIVGWGVVHDIYDAEQATAILLLTGKNANVINEASFGAFFGELQRILGQALLLAVARMYEHEGRTYPLRSIPAALAFLKEHCNDIPVRDRSALISTLSKLGQDDETLKPLADGDLTLALVKVFLSELERLKLVAGESIKTIRDKVIAHRERIAENSLSRPTYAQIDELIAFAKDLTTTVGYGYTGVGYGVAGNAYYLTTDAQRSTHSLMRLLERAGVPITEQWADKEIS